jgi:hypothetical protein
MIPYPTTGLIWDGGGLSMSDKIALGLEMVPVGHADLGRPYAALFDTNASERG